MEMEYWCEFAVLAEEKNYSKTAEMMNLSQSALSKHIMALEKELGVRLFDRSSRKVELSEAGQRFLPYAAAVQKQLHDIKTLAARIISDSGVDISIASIPVMAQYGIIDLIAAFEKKYPKVGIQVSECESINILQRLADGEYDLAFVRGMDDDRFDYIPVAPDHLTAVLPENHPLSGESSVSLSRLSGEDFCFLDKETGIYNLCLRLCAEAGFAPRIKYIGRRPENLLEMVASGRGIALLMHRHTEYLSSPTTVAVPLDPPVELPVCIAKRKDKELSRWANTFLAEISR